MHAEVLVEVECNLTVRACTESMTALSQFIALPLEVVELAVYDNTNAFVLVRYGLVAGREVYDTQAGVAKAHTLVFRKPYALVIGPAMNEALDRGL
jgi:hypothetical protein